MNTRIGEGGGNFSVERDRRRRGSRMMSNRGRNRNFKVEEGIMLDMHAILESRIGTWIHTVTILLKRPTEIESDA